jgi:hypothetical protein
VTTSFAGTVALPLLGAKKRKELERACRDVIAIDPQHAAAD